LKKLTKEQKYAIAEEVALKLKDELGIAKILSM
jgi:hypothetical protein